MLIKAGDLKFNPLDGIATAPPATWNGAHVGVQLAEAFRTLAAMPACRASASGFWPAYTHDWQDLLAQQEAEADDKARANAQANRIRIAPSIEAVSRMETAIYWPARYLAPQSPDMARAVNAVACAIAFERDASWVARRYGGNVRQWQRDYVDGCIVIAVKLVRDCVAVF
jgi:hypothetical protein